MSADRIQVAILEEFVKKVRMAAKSGHKELKFSVSELENVCHNLNLVSLRLLDKEQKTEIRADNDVINVVMDGGGFEETR